MTFSTQQLVGHRVLVSGTDSTGVDGKVVVDSTQWDEVNHNTEYDKALGAFERAVEDFFAPLTQAADAANEAMKKPEDPITYVVLNEEVKGEAAKPAQLINLNHDSVVLRLLDEGKSDRLVWVDGGLEVLNAAPAVGNSNGPVDPADDITISTDVTDPNIAGA